MSTLALSHRVKKSVYGDGPIEPLPPQITAAVCVLVTISALAAWVALYTSVLSGLQQQRTNTVLYSQLRQGLSEATTPIGGVIPPGTPIALLQAPSLGLPSTVIVEGTAPSDLKSGPGHKRDTPLPGQYGVSVLYGRSLTWGAPFRHLDETSPGQQITVTTGQGMFTYSVDGVRHSGDPLPVPLAAGGSRLMLETSTGSGLTPGKTVFVDATLKGTAVAAPPGRLSAIPPLEKAMSGDNAGLIRLVLWLQLLVVVAAAVVWARSRWGQWQSWLVGIPAVIAVLWGATGNILMMLPNLI
jgi:sortase A